MKMFLPCLLAVLLLCGLADAQAKRAQPLKLVVTLPKNYVCFGDSVDFIARVTNISRGAIVIDTKAIGYRTNFSWIDSVPDGGGGGASVSVGHEGTNYKPNFKVLKPGESYRENGSSVIDAETSSTGNYKMHIAYGQFGEVRFQGMVVWRGVIESAEIPIRFTKCKRSSPN